MDYRSVGIGKGSSVVFKAEVYKELWGTHDFDALKIWIDSDKSGIFGDLAGELILTDMLQFGNTLYTDHELIVQTLITMQICPMIFILTQSLFPILVVFGYVLV